MRPELPAILRAIARDYGLAGPQYATMAATLREAADELEKRNANSDQLRAAAATAACWVVDGDAIPGVRCGDCED